MNRFSAIKPCPVGSNPQHLDRKGNQPKTGHFPATAPGLNFGNVAGKFWTSMAERSKSSGKIGTVSNTGWPELRDGIDLPRLAPCKAKMTTSCRFEIEGPRMRYPRQDRR
jgi:hypothetical protein